MRPKRRSIPGAVEPGGGLVEDHEAGSERESARDLDELALLHA